MLCPHEPEAADRGAHPQGDELFCNPGCLLMDFQKGSRSLGFEETNQPSRAGFCSLPTQEVLVELPVPLGSAVLHSGTCEWNPASFGGPALPLLVQESGCAALLFLPCPSGT